MSARRRIRPAGRSSRAHNRMRHTPHSASTSAFARCDTLEHPNSSAMEASLCERRRGRAMRESASESIQMSVTSAPPETASINPRSNAALCAITGAPPTKSASRATASSAEGACATSAFVMFVSSVISAGMSACGLTKVSKRSTTSLPRRRAAAISMSSFSRWERPVVSVSSTTTSSSIRPNERVSARTESVAYASMTSCGVPGSTACAITRGEAGTDALIDQLA